MMWVLIKTFVVYLLLLLFSRQSRDKFISDITRKCKKRRQWKRVPGITEELEEVSHVPPNCRDTISFTGFSEDGEVFSFRINRSNNVQETANVNLEIPGIGTFRYKKTRPLHFGRGKLRLEMLDPMRRWKVTFHGPLERIVSDTCTELVHGSISLYWQCTADPYDYWSCVSPWQLATNLAMQPLALIWSKLSTRSVRYDQWGQFQGDVKINGNEDRFVEFQGFRERKIEDTRELRSQSRLSHHVIMSGRKLFLTNGCVVDHRHPAGKETFGYVTYPLGERWSTWQAGLELLSQEGLDSTTFRYPCQTMAKGISYTVDRTLTREVKIEGNEEGIKSAINVSRFTINGLVAYGINVVEVESPEDINVKPMDEGNSFNDLSQSHSRLTVQLSSPDCRNRQLVGGKGSNLATVKGHGYLVPDGFCITTAALEAHVLSEESLRKATESIEATIRKKELSTLPMVCAEAARLCIATDIPEKVKNAIANELKNTFGTDFESKPLAVRSSGLGEDSQETSLAGQLDTFLAVKGLEQIFQHVKKCWASSLAYLSVEYRRQNGQPVLEPMAVVLQEMVDPDVAGVLFTTEPVTGSSTTMVINAAPGLGEIVVSGKTDPDTVWISRRSRVDDFEITKKKVGKKPVRLTISLANSGLSEVSNDTLADQVCLSDDQIFAICSTGVKMEEVFGAPQDVEWAISQGKLYLLQSRPITSQLDDTDDQLIHEFDKPGEMESSLRTISNIGEMLPGAPTPLTHDYFIGDLNLVLEDFYGDLGSVPFPVYAHKVIGTTFGRPYIDATPAISCAIGDFLVTQADIEIFFFGQAMEEHTLETLRTCKGREKTFYEALKGMVMSKIFRPRQLVKQFDEWTKDVSSFNIGEGASSARELNDAITDQRNLHVDIWLGYFHKMQPVAVAIIMGMLRGGNDSFSTENSADIALMLANCKNVCSADVPSALAELAQAISSSPIKNRFVELNSESCHALLMDSEETIRTKYVNFLEKQGHRCIKEVDFLEKSWAAEPRKLIDTLKPLVESGCVLSKPKVMTNAEIVDSLQTPLSWFQRFLIRNVLLDKAKAVVAAREQGKSDTIKMVDAFKRAYWRLADMMVREGRLPEETLLFFLTSREIGTLIETRSASLIQKARMRRRVFPRMEAIRLPKFCFKRMLPLPEKSTAASPTTLSLRGMPVGKGVATGRACVLNCLADADNIQKGDILICPFTDVGWSPYFSMIAGLVTEIGGLISHGAVVAREVGIPCVVNVDDATMKFQTGDRVRIDGLKGILEKYAE